ncbi:sensor histidine kinase [Luteimonas suaedae]|uniref:sensor histidine kinase n=1 Tax=Luteimonas suaedae TaxID=2605430 RepID=UPI0011EDB413|nr:histidine kinase [Luteimonas suaedae]
MRKVPWLIVIGVVGWWGLNAVIVTSHLLAFRAARGQPISLQEILPAELMSAAIWVVSTLWLLWWTARSPLERERWLAPLGTLLLAILAVVVFRNTAVLVLEPWVDWYNTPPRGGTLMVSSMLRNFLVGCVIVGIGHALVYAQRSRTRERQAQVLQERLTQARLDTLSAQLNPHFLFNSLNSIAEMVHHDADAADTMLVQLGGLLRHSLESSRQQHTSLHDELGALECYIGIEQVRLGHRLRFTCDVGEDVLFAQVPRLMLQPLVENAVAHAVAQRVSPTHVEVRAWREGDRLLLEVLDDGAGTSAKPGFGMGLANTRDRLECLYGAAQSLEMTTLPRGGTRVRVSLPLTLGTAA